MRRKQTAEKPRIITETNGDCSFKTTLTTITVDPQQNAANIDSIIPKNNAFH